MICRALRRRVLFRVIEDSELLVVVNYPLVSTESESTTMELPIRPN